MKKTHCQFVKSYASGSKKAPWLSKFFRECLGKGFSITDIDFLITKKSILIEEKDFTQGNFGLLGDGQYKSFNEIMHDIYPGIALRIIVNKNDDYYVVDFAEINPDNRNNSTRWGDMIQFDLGRKYSIKEIVRMYK